MTTSVTITTHVQGSNLVVHANLISPADVPLDIFLYENTGTTTLGAYFGVANLQDYNRIRAWTGSAIPVFGNKYVKHTQADFSMPIETSPTTIVNKLKKDIGQFKKEYQATGSTTQIVVIS